MWKDYGASVLFACNIELKRKSFDDYLREEKYKACKETTNKGRNDICFNCIACDKINGKCLVQERQRIESGLCWKAKNIHILKRSGLYGQKRTVKSGVD